MAVPNKHGSGGQAWFCTTGLPSDVVFQVRDMTFHLHKFPLMSKCGKIQRLIADQDQTLQIGTSRKQPRHSTKKNKTTEQEEKRYDTHEIEEEEIVEEEEEEEEETEQRQAYQISLSDFPGGPGTFETAAKFCYGVKIQLSAWNVIPLRCAAEYLDMSDDLSEDNLISCTDRYLNQSVLRHLSQASKALKSCEDLLPFAEELGLVQRCVDSIAARVSSSDPTLLFGWPVNGGSTTPSQPVLWNGLDTGIRRRSGPRSISSSDSWLEDISLLNLAMYKRVISAMAAQHVPSQTLEASIVAYANRCIPGLSRSSQHHSSAPVVSETEQRDILETVITNLPPEKSRSGMASTRFLFRLLRTANILRASEASRTVLERKIGSQLERATVYDLLIPNYSYHEEMLYDVDCVERIVKYFVLQLEGEVSEEAEPGRETPQNVRKLTRVGKLVDAYLAEIACDANLKPEKFCGLALVLPDEARVYDDGLYRAVDIYLKEHGKLQGEERERLCGIVDCRKLTMEACTHAAQNERLPLRAVLQVLFFEQLQLRQAIAGNLILPTHQSILPRGREEGDSWQSTVRENQVLRLDMDGMRTRVHELERECSTMKKVIRKIDGQKSRPHVKDKNKDKDKDKDSESISISNKSTSTSSAKRKGIYGCRFGTQVCDSHERTVVESRTAARVQLSP
ncbi:hypothetical protein LUZ60_006161 [Juncus effusus]|nr:hypothetical protein LUZ60_006161 [Juncus effusus]